MASALCSSSSGAGSDRRKRCVRVDNETNETPSAQIACRSAILAIGCMLSLVDIADKRNVYHSRKEALHEP